MSVIYRDMMDATAENGEDIAISVVRNKGYVSTFKTRIFAEGSGHDEENIKFIDRIVKTCLWIRGGYKIIISGSETVYNAVKKAYAKGGPRDQNNIRKSFNSLMKKLGIEGATLHSTRHTAASRWAKQKVNPEITKKFLGHADISTTLNIYTHTDLPQILAAAALSGMPEPVSGLFLCAYSV